MKLPDQVRQIIRKKVIEDEVRDALEILLETENINDDLKDVVVNLLARHNRVEKQEAELTLDHHSINIEKNSINAAILDLLDGSSAISQQLTHKKNNRRNHKLIAGLISMLIVGWLFYQFWERGLNHTKLVEGHVVFVENGMEQPVANCRVKVINRDDVSPLTTDDSGSFSFSVKDRKQPSFEFQFLHEDFEYATETITLDFTGWSDELFTKAFKLEKKIIPVDKNSINERRKKYNETAQVLGFLTTEKNRSSDEYQSKLKRFWQLYKTELTAVETPEVESQMVVIGRILEKINNNTITNPNELENLEMTLSNEAIILSKIFRKELN